ncbi:hypothetical protein Tco_0696463 [Tanacetum coccineum]
MSATVIKKLVVDKVAEVIAVDSATRVNAGGAGGFGGVGGQAEALIQISFRFIVQSSITGAALLVRNSDKYIISTQRNASSTNNRAESDHGTITKNESAKGERQNGKFKILIPSIKNQQGRLQN